MFFLALGLLRDLGSWAELGALSRDGIEVSEFDSLWANAVDLLRARESGGLHVPVAARFGEFWAFIPSQLLPFQKLSLSDWFVQTFYPAYQEAGGGLAFGAISQAMIGGGVPALRGGVLDALATWAMKWHRSPTATWWRLPLYLYLLIFVFQSVRDTTFRQLDDVVQLVWPALLFVALTGKLFAPEGNATRPAGGTCGPSSM